MTSPAARLRQKRVWVVAVDLPPPDRDLRDLCGSSGSRQEVVMLDARDGRELLHYTYC